jgi:hypothetical protein
MDSFNVVKGNGEQEPFKLSKLRTSLSNSGATDPVIKSVVNELDEQGLFRDGISTKKLYSEAYKHLRSHSDHVAGRYKLKQALFDMGPSGFPFEQLVSEIFSRIGYQTKVGEIVEGKCVSHEIDVIAEDADSVLMIECKFHNRQGHNSTVTTPLYIQSRFLDVNESWKNNPDYLGKKRKGYIVTNTRFTSDAVDYANCMNLELLSWDYPQNAGLKQLIERTKLHPITSLSCLTKNEKKRLMDHLVVHCKHICEHPEVLDKLGFNHSKKSQIISEAQALCNTTNS